MVVLISISWCSGCTGIGHPEIGVRKYWKWKGPE